MKCHFLRSCGILLIGVSSLSLPTNLRTMVWYCCYCIYRYIHGYVVIMMFEFGEYCFIKLLKWKFKFWNFLSENSKFSIFDRSKLWLDRSKWQENNPRASGWIDHYSISVWLIKKSTRLVERNFRPIKSRKTRFSAKFYNDCYECLKMYQALWIVLWKILTLDTCFWWNITL